MKLRVTGGTVFIGSNFVRYIKQRYRDYRIVVVDSLTPNARADRVLNLEKLQALGIEVKPTRNDLSKLLNS